MAESSNIIIKKGVAYIYFAYDAGFSIDLNQAQQKLKLLTERAKIRQNRRSPWYFEFEPAPIKVTHSINEIPIGSYTTTAEAEATIFDFGAISVQLKIPFSGPLSNLVKLSYDLYENEEIEKKCRTIVEETIQEISSAIHKEMLNEHFEEYKIFQIQEYEGMKSPRDIVQQNSFGKNFTL